MAKKRAGWEKKIYYGTAGSTAATHIDANVENIAVTPSNEYNETTDRGDGSAVPKMTEQLIKQSVEVTFSMQYKDGDTKLAALLANSQAGTVTAIKVERHASGVTEFDGDVYISYESPGELTGGQVISFTCHPTDDGGRKWSFT